MQIYLAQILQIILLNIKKIFKNLLIEYLNFIDMFLKKLTTELANELGIVKYVITFKINKHLSYKLIYNLKFIKLKIFKTYIKV